MDWLVSASSRSDALGGVGEDQSPAARLPAGDLLRLPGVTCSSQGRLPQVLIRSTSSPPTTLRFNHSRLKLLGWVWVLSVDPSRDFYPP